MRDADRDFIESLSKVQAAYGGFRLRDGRVDWLSDVLKCAVARFAAA